MIKLIVVFRYGRTDESLSSSSTTIIFQLRILVVNVAIYHQGRMSKKEGFVVDKPHYVMSCYCTELPRFTCS
jgi:hypothetical protein